MSGIVLARKSNQNSLIVQNICSLGMNIYKIFLDMGIDMWDGKWYNSYCTVEQITHQLYFSTVLFLLRYLRSPIFSGVRFEST